ncbi:MAG TPA: S41 family peptidase [Flavobacteriaceae bacterium]|nr:S41 family peptidase [Flavobacteriaceae bacterium]
MKKTVIAFLLASVISIGAVSYKNDYFEIAKQIEIFTTLFKELNMNYVDETIPAELMDKAIKGMLEGLDPYTVYYNEQDVEQAKINQTGSYSGIGAYIRNQENRLLVIEPWKDGPADKAGLKAGDEIIQIGDVKVANFNDDAGELLKGAPGSSVEVTYSRQGKTNKVTVTREAVEINAVPFYTLIEGNIGYIVLSTFNQKTTTETKAALNDLKKQGATGIILDLRGNGGGLMREAINVMNLFVPKGEVITTTKSVVQKYNQVYQTTVHPVDVQIPVAVLINGRSASASEIVAGAFQDLDRGVVIGARSFGKGLVQRPKKLTYGTQLKVTISKYYTPSGRCIQAEDYFHRDENGDPVRATPENYNAFKTKNGRTVYDGGGIQPDVELASAKFSPITTSLLKANSIFDFATEFYYKNPSIDKNNFLLSEKDYNDFLAFLKRSNFSFETETEIALKEVLKKAENENLKEGLEKSYQLLLQDLNKVKDRELQDKKIEIQTLVTDEIVKRYFYKEGLYEYQVKNSPEIKEAVAVLKDKNRYNKILKGK